MYGILCIEVILMRSTIDIDEKLLEEARKLTRVRTKKELINRALTELIRKERIEKLREKLGHVELALDLEMLDKMRADK